jgi:hypothetical protein
VSSAREQCLLVVIKKQTHFKPQIREDRELLALLLFSFKQKNRPRNNANIIPLEREPFSKHGRLWRWGTRRCGKKKDGSNHQNHPPLTLSKIANPDAAQRSRDYRWAKALLL